MDRAVGAAVRPLPESDRKDLAIQALAGSETVSDLAARHGVSRKFVYQPRKVHAALDGAFSSAKQDTEEVLFEESMQNRGGLVLARVRCGLADGARTGQRRCGG